MGNVSISINTDRIDKNLKEAHRLLNMQVGADSNALVPFSQGALRSSMNFPQGIYGDEIEWNTPYAHYQYVGDLYLTEDGRSWARKGEKKYPTGIPLKHRHGTSQWFEEAKRQHLDDWIALVKREVDNA